MILGISGKATSGKDTTANIVRKFYPDTTILHFGDALKNVASNAFCLDRDLLDEQFYKRARYGSLNMTVREILQKIGTLFRENFYENIWIDKVINKINEQPDISWVIPDVRFPNEKKAIEDLGGVVIRVERPGIPIMNHISETALDDAEFYYTIQNDGTLEDLEVKVKEFFRIL